MWIQRIVKCIYKHQGYFKDKEISWSLSSHPFWADGPGPCTMSATQSQCFFLWCFGVSLDRNKKTLKKPDCMRMYGICAHVKHKANVPRYILYSVFIVLFSLSNYLQNTVLIGCFLQSSLVCLAAKNFKNCDSVQISKGRSPVPNASSFATDHHVCSHMHNDYLQHETCYYTSGNIYMSFYTCSSLLRYPNHQWKSDCCLDFCTLFFSLGWNCRKVVNEIVHSNSCSRFMEKYTPSA